ncbi:MAG: ATP-binding protein [Clostridia bacterium]|nr:ATP-binding protein [Clostridia bacterium]
MGNEFRQYMELIGKRAMAQQVAGTEDYVGEDGLLYCGKCHTPRQCRPEGFDMVMPVICDCRREQARRAEQERRVAFLRERCFDSPRQYCATFENDLGYDPRATRVMMSYVEHFDSTREDGIGLLLYGPFGTGKSYHACQVANALIDRLLPVKVTQFEDLYRLSQNERDKSAFFRSLTRNALVVIDDLGAEKKSDAMQSFVFTVIDKLYISKTPFIVTTNLTIDELKRPENKENGRIYERILERCPYPVLVERKEGSVRRQLIRENYEKYKALWDAE